MYTITTRSIPPARMMKLDIMEKGEIESPFSQQQERKGKKSWAYISNKRSISDICQAIGNASVKQTLWLFFFLCSWPDLYKHFLFLVGKDFLLYWPSCIKIGYLFDGLLLRFFTFRFFVHIYIAMQFLGLLLNRQRLFRRLRYWSARKGSWRRTRIL